MKAAMMEGSLGSSGSDPQVEDLLASGLAAALGGPLIDTFIDAALTPQNLSRLIQTSLKERDEGTTEPASTRSPSEGLQSRVVRAFFTGPMTFEIVLGDSDKPKEAGTAVMELQGLGWELTELHVPGPQ
jgi:hypothetical protein